MRLFSETAYWTPCPVNLNHSSYSREEAETLGGISYLPCGGPTKLANCNFYLPHRTFTREHESTPRHTQFPHCVTAPTSNNPISVIVSLVVIQGKQELLETGSICELVGAVSCKLAASSLVISQWWIFHEPCKSILHNINIHIYIEIYMAPFLQPLLNTSPPPPC